MIKMRKLWTQREVIEIANFLHVQREKFNNNSLNYWRDKGVFPDPVNSEKGMYSWYRTDDVIAGILSVAMRTRPPVKITQEDVEMAMSKVLESNKAKYISKMLRQ